MAVVSFYSPEIVRKYHGGNYIRFKQEVLQYLYLSKVTNNSRFIILDIGAGGGLSFYVRNKLGLKTPIWAVEPTIEMFNHLIRNTERVKGDDVISLSGDEIPEKLYNHVSLITLISVGGAVKKIFNKDWEPKWFSILIKAFNILLIPPKKRLFIQVYSKPVAKRVISMIKAFNLTVKSINGSVINRLNDLNVNLNLNYLREIYYKINHSKATDDLIRSTLSSDNHFHNNHLYLGYCFWVEPKTQFKNVVPEKVFKTNETINKLLIDKGLLNNLKRLTNEFKELRIKFIKRQASYKEVINYLIKSKINNCSLIDLWLFHPVSNNKELNNRLMINKQLITHRSKNAFNEKINAYLLSIIKFFDELIHN